MPIGDPDALAARLTTKAASEWAFIPDAIAKAAPHGDSAITAALKALHGDDRIVTPLAQSGTLANLGGQMHVRLVEMHGRKHLLDRLHRLDGETGDWLSMPFDEAVKFWEAKGGDPDLLQAVLGAYRKQAAGASSEMLDVISRRAIAALGTTLTDGGTVDDFIKAMNEGTVGLGLVPANPSYLATVFKTNTAVAYGAGRWTQMNDPDVLALRPWRQWRTAEDERVRPEHAAGDGMIWRADNAAFANVAAPGGFNCRCETLTLDADDLKDEGGQVLDEPPEDFEIDDGFGAESFGGSGDIDAE